MDFGYSLLGAGYQFRFSNTKADMIEFATDTRNTFISVLYFDEYKHVLFCKPSSLFLTNVFLSKHRYFLNESLKMIHLLKK